MSKLLFESLDRDNDPIWIAKEFFNSISPIFFTRVVSYLIHRTSYGNEYSDCEFPENLDEEDLLDGIRFTYLDEVIVLSEEDFKTCLILACEKYQEVYPEERDELNELLGEL